LRHAFDIQQAQIVDLILEFIKSADKTAFYGCVPSAFCRRDEAEVRIFGSEFFACQFDYCGPGLRDYGRQRRDGRTHGSASAW
jgi:hypothetical protein